METPKRLNEILPVEKRLTVHTLTSEILDKEITITRIDKPVLDTAKFYTAYYVVKGESVPRITLFNQEQITGVFDYLLENDALPIRVMFILSGKSYAIVDPEEHPKSQLDK